MQQLAYFGDLLNFDIIPSANIQIETLDEVKYFFEELLEKHMEKKGSRNNSVFS